jgi:hypothetical protein
MGSWRSDPALREAFAFEPPEYLRYEGILMRGADAVKASFDGEFRGAVFLAATDERVDGEIVYARIDPEHVKPAPPGDLVIDEYADD